MRFLPKTSSLLIFIFIFSPTFAQSSFSEKLPENLIFSEIFPNPIGEDSGKEWIEIENNSKQNINLKNWQIKKSNKKSAPYTITENKILKPTEKTIIKTPFNINNTQEHLTLLNPQNKIIHEINYKKSTEGETLNLIKTYDKTELINYEWEWSDNISPGKNNYSYEILSGEISQCLDEHFILKNHNNFFKIHFSNFTPALAKSIFQKNSSIQIKTQKINENYYLLKNFEIQNQPAKPLPEKNQIQILISIIFMGLLTFIIILKKRNKT